MSFKKFRRYFKKNYILLFFIICIVFIGIVAGIKLFGSPSTYIYVKMKVGQGYWWVSARPTVWYSNSIQKNEVAYDLLGQPVAQIMEVRKYPSFSGENAQFDQYVTLKMKVHYDKENGQYSFERTPVLVGAPLEVQFPLVDITGSVVEVSVNKPSTVYKDKIVTFAYQGGYNKDFPYRYDEIKIGDRYFDGEDTVFQVIDKRLDKNVWAIADNLNGQVYERQVEATQNVVVKAKVKVETRADGDFYAGEYRIAKGLQAPFSTNSFYFDKFVIVGIE